MRFSDGGRIMMRYALIILSIFGMVGLGARVEPSTASGSSRMKQISQQNKAQNKRFVIAASILLDGRGRVLRNTRIVIEGSKIVAIDPKAAPVDYDLRGLTVMPGWIDAHVHITWSFGKDGKNAGQGGSTPESTYQSAANAWLTLMAGFTTVQSVGSAADMPLRDAIAQGTLAGPRIL